MAYLGNPFGTDEAAGFDIGDSGTDETVYEFDLEVDGDHAALFVLETIAWPDFNDVDNIVSCCCCQ